MVQQAPETDASTTGRRLQIEASHPPGPTVQRWDNQRGFHMPLVLMLVLVATFTLHMALHTDSAAKNRRNRARFPRA
jgi:hypothetical protein